MLRSRWSRSGRVAPGFVVIIVVLGIATSFFGTRGIPGLTLGPMAWYPGPVDVEASISRIAEALNQGEPVPADVMLQVNRKPVVIEDQQLKDRIAEELRTGRVNWMRFQDLLVAPYNVPQDPALEDRFDPYIAAQVLGKLPCGPQDGRLGFKIYLDGRGGPYQYLRGTGDPADWSVVSLGSVWQTPVDAVRWVSRITQELQKDRGKLIRRFHSLNPRAKARAQVSRPYANSWTTFDLLMRGGIWPAIDQRAADLARLETILAADPKAIDHVDLMVYLRDAFHLVYVSYGVLMTLQNEYGHLKEGVLPVSVSILSNADLGRPPRAAKYHHQYAIAARAGRKSKWTWPIHALSAATTDYNYWYSWATNESWYAGSGYGLDAKRYPKNSPETREMFEDFADFVVWVGKSGPQSADATRVAIRAFADPDFDTTFSTPGKRWTQGVYNNLSDFFLTVADEREVGAKLPPAPALGGTP